MDYESIKFSSFWYKNQQMNVIFETGNVNFTIKESKVVKWRDFEKWLWLKLWLKLIVIELSYWKVMKSEK
jgi:hypothetical protein